MACPHSAPHSSLRSKLSAVLDALKAWCFQEHIVVVSHPLCANERWSIIQGDRYRFSVREFSSESEAWFGFKSITSATALGTGIVQIRIVILNEEQARLARDSGAYRMVIDLLERASRR